MSSLKFCPNTPDNMKLVLIKLIAVTLFLAGYVSVVYVIATGEKVAANIPCIARIMSNSENDCTNPIIKQMMVNPLKPIKMVLILPYLSEIVP